MIDINDIQLDEWKEHFPDQITDEDLDIMYKEELDKNK